MDRDRFKNNKPIVPVKRSINGEEKPEHAPTPGAPVSRPPLPAPAAPAKQPAATAPVYKQTAPVGSKPKAAPAPDKPVPALFDGEDDEDLFGIWATQKKLKKARQEKEAQERAAKLAAKMLKKEKKKVAKTTEKPHELAISLSIPRVSKFKKKHPKLLWAITGALIIIVALGIFIVLRSDNKPKTQAEVLGQEAAKPDFDTVYPAGTTNATAIKYDPTKKVASYKDTINGTEITISEQPLPTGFAGDVAAKVANLAEQISATEKISATDTTAYAGLSAKGPQTVVFAKNDLLIFIIATEKIETLDWIRYIDSIQ